MNDVSRDVHKFIAILLQGIFLSPSENYKNRMLIHGKYKECCRFFDTSVKSLWILLFNFCLHIIEHIWWQYFTPVIFIDMMVRKSKERHSEISQYFIASGMLVIESDWKYLQLAHK